MGGNIVGFGFFGATFPKDMRTEEMAGDGSAGVEDERLFAKGRQVEVSTDEEGFGGAWFVATVLDPPSSSKSASRRKKKGSTNPSSVYVEYESLLANEAASKPLREHVDLSFIRPLPPWDAYLDCSFQLDDVVDAYYKDGWWTGVITRVFENSRYVVTFQNPPDEIEFVASELRVHLDWINRQWVRPEKQRTTRLMFTVEQKVEVSFDKEDNQDVWFPATVLEDFGNGSFLVEYQSVGIGDGAVIEKVLVDCFHIRPSPPCLKEKNFALLEKVDALYDFGWSSGVINKELSDDRYVVFFKHTKKEREFSHSELRPHLEWKDGKWFSTSQEFLVRSECQEHEELACDNANECSLGVPVGSSCSTMGNSGERAPCSVDSRETQTEQSYSCNEKPSHVMTSVMNNINQTPDGDATHLWPLKKFKEGNNVETSPFTPCQFDSTCTETPIKNSLDIVASFAAESMGTNLVDQPLIGDLPFAKADKLSQGKSADHHAIDSKKRKGRPAKTQVKSSQPLAGGVMNVLSHILWVKIILTLWTNYFNVFVEVEVKFAGKELGNATEDFVQRERKTKVNLPIVVGCNGMRVSRAKKPRQFYGEEPVKLMKDQKQQLSDPVMEKAKGTQLGGLGSNEKRRRGRPPKFLDKGPAASDKDSLNVAGKDVAETDNSKKVAEVTIDNLAGNMSDDQPLSTWFEGMHSPISVDCSRISYCGSVYQCNKVDEGQKQIVAGSPATDTEGKIVPREILRLPFVKNIQIWETIESMEVFRRMPQKPHFRPLNDCKESSREGLAIGSMVTFSSVVEKTSKLQFDDPRSTIEDSLETLVDLESYGFNVQVVQDRLTRLLLVKDQQEQIQDQIEEINNQIQEHNLKKTKMDKEIEEVDQQIRELQEKRAMMSKMRGIKDSNISSLQSRMEEISESIVSARCEFGRLASTPF